MLSQGRFGVAQDLAGLCPVLGGVPGAHSRCSFPFHAQHPHQVVLQGGFPDAPPGNRRQPPPLPLPSPQALLRGEAERKPPSRGSTFPQNEGEKTFPNSQKLPAWIRAGEQTSPAAFGLDVEPAQLVLISGTCLGIRLLRGKCHVTAPRALSLVPSLRKAAWDRARAGKNPSSWDFPGGTVAASSLEVPKASLEQCGMMEWGGI